LFSGLAGVSITVASAFLFFFHLTNKNIPPAATTKQHIQTTGLTAIQANHIVTNPTTIVAAKAINLVHAQAIFDKNGITLAIVSTNCNIIENPQNISNNQINLIIHVIAWLSF
jgi:hypothetical protein